MKIDYKIAMAAGQDAGNRNAKKHNRQDWNEEDWNVAAEVFHKLNNFGKGAIICEVSELKH